ncbi:MAG: NAD-dependent epimerase/dehydratase family protein [Acidobacteriota bacterium]
MSVVMVTGAAGLVGSEAVEHFVAQGHDVIGIDNDMRRTFFGDEASTDARRRQLEDQLGARYRHHDLDIRDAAALDALFATVGDALVAVVHAAAQPSHDWAARDPVTDFTVNANGTLHLLESTRRHAPEAVFVFTSTNKVYGDRPNALPLETRETRYELPDDHPYADGIPETMPIDRCLHSLFGASKVAADVLVQEYGRYFDLRTVSFRGGCLTGPHHAGTRLHGFLAYLMRCTMTGTPYTVFGYDGLQVRDNIHSADLIAAFDAVVQRPPIPGAVYNIGGGRFSHCSMREAIVLCQEIAGRALDHRFDPQARVGDHKWWISDLSRFRADYPDWRPQHDVPAILRAIHDANRDRWRA